MWHVYDNYVIIAPNWWIVSDILSEAHCTLCCGECDALSHSDDVTSFQGVVQHKQTWPDLSKLRALGWFSVKETEPGLSALSNILYILQEMRMVCVMLLSGSACDLKMAARYMRHQSECLVTAVASLSP